MALSISADDRAFRDRVESGAIEPAEFDHRAHLRLAYLYLAGADEDAAYRAMRDALRGLLAHHGIDAAKYHDTITRACGIRRPGSRADTALR